MDNLARRGPGKTLSMQAPPHGTSTVSDSTKQDKAVDELIKCEPAEIEPLKILSEEQSSDLETSRVGSKNLRNQTIEESSREKVAQALLNNINKNLESRRPYVLS